MKHAKALTRQETEKVKRGQSASSNGITKAKSGDGKRNNNNPKAQKLPSHKELLGFIGSESHSGQDGIPFNFIDYLDLIDWTSRIVRSDKRGAVPAKAKKILERFSINDEAWVESVDQFENRFGYAIGADRALKHYRHNLSTHWLRGQRAIQQLYRQTEAA